MKKLVMVLFLITSLNAFSQANNDIKKSFVLRFLEENIVVVKNKDTKYNLYNPDFIEIEINNLNNYDSDYMFYRFKLGENTIKANDEKLEILFNSSSCNEYILALNIINKKSYRIKGFNGNDFLFLLKDISELSTERKTIKKIVSELDKIHIGVNFTDIYNALKKLDYNADCLKSCSEPKEAHGKVR
ncbi:MULTISPECIES: hypothetical protein [unclassified Flavobacterium]|uniref:hypothetical protein n=1 Tax=unclassified Flavobacterium TaxID=196869 RepID=UPI00086E4827|nr:MULTISPECIES: hypothetical protein [unclassified Flavobacterium]MBN9285642.1 hypothetical protein [Flavobacterium sp.]ODS91934.1 MAG: hypothetical protein ABS44_00105 [Chryseobacterium sp. SCN 40-13]OJV71002.1 MAG: hypothetical protein BGO42_04100 [Flavobacterium sp. 40-81]